MRTNPDAPKHQGITTMVIDMHAPGVTVRPLKMPSGNSDFNEIFFDDVFVPDEDVVGPVDAGWTVARATLGNESVSIGGGDGGMTMPARAFIAPLDAHPERLAGGAGRVGRHIARTQALAVLNQRSAYRAVAGGEPGPEGNIAKLLLSELGHETAAIMAELAGPDGAFLEGAGAMAASLVLMNRAMSIAGRDLGDQAEPDSRTDPGPAPGPAHQQLATGPNGPGITVPPRRSPAPPRRSIR